MSTYAIHTNIPMPTGQVNRGRKHVYAFGEMQVGQCFFVPLHDKTVTQIKSRVRTAAANWRAEDIEARRSVRFRYAEGIDPTNGTPAVGIWREA